MRLHKLAVIFLFSFLAIGLPAIGLPVSAKIPEAVKTQYRAYNAALKKGDYKTAYKNAKAAWELAEKDMGDTYMTGRLASNYGLVALKLKKYDDAVIGFERALKLVKLEKNYTPLTELERRLNLANAYFAQNSWNKALKFITESHDFARKNNLETHVFIGELRVLQARIVAQKANSSAKRGEKKFSRIKSKTENIQDKAADYAREAVEIFNKNPEYSNSLYLATAYKIIGFGHERKKEWLEATLAYQNALKIMEKTQTQKDEALNDEAFLQTVGRWVNTRKLVFVEMGGYNARGKLNAKGAGVCLDCFLGKDDGVKRIAEPIKRVPPVMPINATVSGFSFVEFDLDDKGKPINIKILHSWPKKMYEHSSLRAVRQWRYTPRTDGETDAMRQGFTTTINYILKDDWGGKPL